MSLRSQEGAGQFRAIFDEANGSSYVVELSPAPKRGETIEALAVLQGATVVNNPFMWTADDKFFDAGLCEKLGVASPKTMVLPNKDYVPGIVHEESLRNLIYPLDWQAIVH